MHHLRPAVLLPADVLVAPLDTCLERKAVSDFSDSAPKFSLR